VGQWRYLTPKEVSQLDSLKRSSKKRKGSRIRR
jgi:hypothetical protein